ncbi:acyl-CoA thioesterase [Cobetia marina]|jgi:acyl-CoA thioesterase YciA|uniref:Acyl-CoA thioesterase n=1 Tax=Cobetia marina TaxID=28258 RepID=A0ABU9GF04_COBMA|nr:MULTISPECIES: acyl-CoA thioesterase [Cobetia]MDA5564063.1 acyl-CoA thioesterase [Cobetia sp. MMG027]MDH2291668.1 acyl-CoA thioesterase [Cobetia sp. 10Alg 146]MDH2374205.1 acyl-CoA thioesterase [Cobetia sp. 3AK]MDI6004607.1 acyl-CoA thioesterase [Cobetia pacifica]MDN2656400.1 acyl-CoA thioesterase [Cobetia sp. 14N.309.X.WAT.E.A4]
MQALDDAPVPNGTLTLKLIAQRHDTNLYGDISGGWLMHRMDEACELAAGRVANGRTATVAVEGLDFLSPVRVGSVVNIFTHVTEVGRSSVRLTVEVWIRPPQERNHRALTKVTEANYVMVALDDNGRIRAVPEQGNDEESV